MAFQVLVCDDSVMARKQASKAVMSILPCAVTHATDGEHALTLMSEQHFDLLCLDLTMPKIDGIGVLQQMRIRKIETYVVVISADVQSQMKQRTAQLGALGFINKPVKTDALADVLHKFGVY
ncbi:response regulator [Pseudoalteromonas sp. Cnat2-41]|uniref:response regulator n=1 Tax=Pseudoalteromonas TaxID=53246 RepID=UPI00034C9B90|nr:MULTISPECIES: response regulator [Pseudoalteromonas]MCF2862841.1 response regulator [Pseudoalteromonas sp. CNAT2-18]MCG7558707.1 response regulator [Pseudoalteromonas sp. CNAT2-18.1]MCG7567163.1 response regulator [Pseudoalteromonas sp. CnMc7-15]RZF88060.1 response regulator [Pseudoalteromonas sp. CO325X]TLX51205.1 response regulator [Pseudoalteromonas ruthenica]